MAEAGAGDPDAARSRLAALEAVTLLDATADAAMRLGIEHVCRRAGYEPPVICTPNELLETDHADDAT